MRSYTNIILILASGGTTLLSGYINIILILSLIKGGFCQATKLLLFSLIRTVFSNFLVLWVKKKDWRPQTKKYFDVW